MNAVKTERVSSSSGTCTERTRKACVEALFEAHYDRLCWFATSYLGNPKAAEDVVQEVFLQVCKHGRAQTLRDPRAYLFRAVRNRALNTCKRKETVWRSDREVDTLSGAGQPCTDERVTCSEIRNTVRRAAAQLSERQREVFILGCVEGFTHTEIAEVLGLSTKTVSTHMARAKKALREGLKRHR